MLQNSTHTPKHKAELLRIAAWLDSRHNHKGASAFYDLWLSKVDPL